MAKKMKLFEWAMAGRKGCVSPYVWRIKMLLAHFGLDYESEMLFGVEMKEALAFAQGEAERLRTKAPYAPNGTVPVLVDGETILPDSWTIAAYLDERYGGGKVVNANPALNRFFESWVGQQITDAVFPTILPETIGRMDEVDREPFRESREAMFGFRFEDIDGSLADCVPALQANLAPLEEALAAHDYIGGGQPIYADYIVFGTFYWLSKVSTTEVLNPDSAVHRWRERLMDANGGLARQN
jgi:glutathione S-transferase